MATGGLARGFLLKGGRQGIFTAGSSKLQASATRASESNDEREKPSESAGSKPVKTTGEIRSKEPVHITDKSHVTGSHHATTHVHTQEPLHTTAKDDVMVPVHPIGPGRTKGPVHTKEPVHMETPVDTTGKRDVKGPVQSREPVHTSERTDVGGPIHLREPVYTQEPNPTTGLFHNARKSDGKESVHNKEPVHVEELVHTTGPDFIKEPVRSTKSSASVNSLAGGVAASGESISLAQAESEAHGEPVVVKELAECVEARSPSYERGSSDKLRQEGSAGKDATEGPMVSEIGDLSTRDDTPGAVASGTETRRVPTGESIVKPAVCEIKEAFEPKVCVPRQQSVPLHDVRTHATGEAFVRPMGEVERSDTDARNASPFGKAETLDAPRAASGSQIPSPESFLSPSQESPSPLPPGMVSFLLGRSPSASPAVQTPTPPLNPFDPTPPGWNAELSIASAVARDDVSARFLNLPTPAMQSVFAKLPASSIVSCQMVSKGWHDRFSDDPKVWASVDLSSDAHLRHVAADELLGKLLDRSKDSYGTSYLTSVDVTGCQNVTAGGLMAVMKHRGRLCRLRAHASGAQLPVYFAKWLADAGIEAHVDMHTGQRAPRLGLADVAHNRSTWQDVIQLLSGSTRVTICGLDLRASPLPFPSDLAIPFLQALFKTPNLQTLRVGRAFRDRDLLRDIGYVLDARGRGGRKGLEVLELESLRGDVPASTWEALFGMLEGSNCRIRKLSIKDCNLGEDGSTFLADALSANTSVKELEVSDCGLVAAAWVRLAKALQRNESVLKLTVGGWGWKGAEAGTGPFEESSLDLIPDDEGVGYLGAAIAQSPTLEVAHIAAWCGPTVQDPTGRVADISPGFGNLLKELSRLEPGTSRLKCILVEYDEMCVGDRGRSGALRVAAMIGYVLEGKGVRVIIANSAQKRSAVSGSRRVGTGNPLGVSVSTGCTCGG